ncbi:hypothetical protein K4K51_004322 [Colletotrichum sp. SAR 10_75]|nr:hypothetical protein K4K51_004322 [Colletotrichum sp. SAR 10_75]
MPESLKKWNIPKTEKHDPETDVLEDTLPWDKVSGVSRYGLFRKDKIEGLHTERSDENHTYRGLSGVNNAWQANTVFASKKKDNAWYPPKTETDPDQKDWKFQGPGTLSDGANRMFCPNYLPTYEEFASTKKFKNGRQPGYLNLDQIDRLFAIWQALNWEKWWNGTEPDHPDPDHPPVAPDADDNRRTPLQPFHLKDNDPEKQAYTADLTRDWNKLGYSYDVLEEIANVEDVVDTYGTLKEEAFKNALRAKLGSLYPSAPVQGGPNKKLTPIPTRMHILQQAADEIHSLKTYEQDRVAKYLTEHLKWRFVLLGGKVVSEKRFPDTVVTVFKGTGRFKIENKKPMKEILKFASLMAGFSY